MSVATDTELAAGLDLVERAFAEDLGGDADGIDLTAAALEGVELEALLVARQTGVTCGLQVAAHAFTRRGVARVEQLVADGERVDPGTPLICVHGQAAAILTAERTALNVVQRLAGTATLTRAFVDAVAGTDAQILDTRKTIPGMRALQRWAVRCGGGHNHRFGLADEAMLKDNHIAACGGIAAALARVRESHPGARVHVEADTLDQAREAVEAGADVILLDNMSNDELRDAVALIGDRALTEASGGVTLATVAAIAATGVDRISIGAITHSAPAFDAALDAV
ncbi:MAG: nicotinate-nucleotide pyrophosphorylase [Thermoleophilia bacterium]|nr:nicotinate-nucleotide pyrophosphorylase [Thermoleophilia bacterium]